jgi:hypothetical protein
MVLGLALLLLTSARPFAEERALLDRRLESLARVLPDGPQPTADTALVTGLTRGIALVDVEVQARAPLETGAKGDLLVDVRAKGRYADVERFFRQVARSPRLIDVETLSLSATTSEHVTMTALLRLPYRPQKAPLPRAPDDVPRPPGTPRPQLEGYLRDHALALAKSEAIASLRRARRNPRLFLSELAAVTRDRPVVLTQATVGEEFFVRGITTGESSVRDLEARLEQGFFRMAEMLVVKQAGCYRFEARGQAPVVGPYAEIPLPTEDPFRLDDGGCRVDRDSSPVTVLRVPRRKGAAPGTVSLRLRGVDLADAFGALHLATGEAFLVDDDVRGRVDLDLDHVTLEEALTVLTRAGVTVSPGPIHHVTRSDRKAGGTSPPVPHESAEGSPRITLAVKRAPLADLLALFGEADVSLVSWGLAPPTGRLSVFAKNMPAATLRSAVLRAAGLPERREDDKRVVAAAEAEAGRLLPVTASRQHRLVLAREDLAVHEFELAGLAGSPEGVVALVYSPGGLLHPYRAGDRIREASLAEVGWADAVLNTDEGALRVRLP